MTSLLKHQTGLKKLRRWTLMAAAACSLSLLSFQAISSDLWVDPLHTVEEAVMPLGSVKSFQAQRRLPAARVALEPLPHRTLNQKQASTELFPGPLQIGNGRPIKETASSESFADLLVWEKLPDGRQVAAIEFVSPEAIGNRIILEIEAIDPRVQFVFSEDDPSSTVTLTGLEVLDSIFRDHSNPGLTHQPASRRFTGPYMSGESTLLEIILPEGVTPKDVKIAVPHLSHMRVSPSEGNPWLKNLDRNTSCNLDSTCRPEWETVSQGVARMLFSEPTTGDSFLCTGSLLNDTENSGTPYFLTANHCISSQSVASTLQTFWFYQSNSCNSGTLNPGFQTRSGGATLLFSQSTTDTTLLQLNSAPPPGATFQGWTTALPRIGQSLGGVHHPGGDVAKISLAKLSRYATCNDNYCLSGTPNDATYLGVTWSSGVTAPGSSGSGLFLANSGQQYLVGQLLGGTSSCNNPTAPDFYGRFDLAYQAGMRDYLNATSSGTPEPSNPVTPPVAPIEQSRTPIFRFYNTNSNAHFFTRDAAERDFVIQTYSSFIYEGVAFYAYPDGGPNLEPVYRFYNEATGSHFYTISEAERDTVLQLFPSYIYEGEAWNARVSSGDGSEPLYRFYNTATLSHFYTTDAGERDFVISSYPTYVYEGTGYYTWPTP